MAPQQQPKNSKSSCLKLSPKGDRNGKRPLLLERHSYLGDPPALHLGKHLLSPQVLVSSNTQTMARLSSGAVSPCPSYLFPLKSTINPFMLAECLGNLSSLSSPRRMKSTTPNPVSHSTVPSQTPLPLPTNQRSMPPQRGGVPATVGLFHQLLPCPLLYHQLLHSSQRHN